MNLGRDNNGMVSGAAAATAALPRLCLPAPRPSARVPEISIFALIMIAIT